MGSQWWQSMTNAAMQHWLIVAAHNSCIKQLSKSVLREHLRNVATPLVAAFDDQPIGECHS